MNSTSCSGRRCRPRCSPSKWKAVRLEFVVRPPLGAGPRLGSGRPNGHCSARHGPPCVRWRRSTACGPSTTRGCVPRCRRPDARRHATVPQSWIQRENWEFETHTVQDCLEAEITAALRAESGERTADRLGLQALNTGHANNADSPLSRLASCAMQVDPSTLACRSVCERCVLGSAGSAPGSRNEENDDQHKGPKRGCQVHAAFGGDRCLWTRGATGRARPCGAARLGRGNFSGSHSHPS